MLTITLVRSIVQEEYRNDDDVDVAPDAQVEWVAGGAWVDVRIFVSQSEIEEHRKQEASA